MEKFNKIAAGVSESARQVLMTAVYPATARETERRFGATRNQHAGRRALPGTSQDLNIDRQQMIDHVSAAIDIAVQRLRSTE